MIQSITGLVLPLAVICGLSLLATNASDSSARIDEEDKEVQEVEPLKNSFEGRFDFGVAVSTGILRGQEDGAEQLTRRHFNSFTAENAMKPYALQPSEGEFTFEDSDRLMEIAEESGAAVVGHTLVWHSQTPPWFFDGVDGEELSREVALERMRTHIQTVVGRYKGRIKEWDVVNEAINDGPGVLRPSPWQRAIGDDYIAEAFRAAHEADPDAILVYNDYNIELDYKRPKAVEMLKGLIEDGVPIHAVGIQAHWRMPEPPLDQAQKAIDEYSELGLKVMFTELDIGVLPANYDGADVNQVSGMTVEQKAVMNPYTEGLPDEVAVAQAEKYRESFEFFLRNQEHIGRVSFWGVHDGHSWLNNFPVRGRTEYPLLFDRDLKPKPAFFEILKAAVAGSN